LSQPEEIEELLYFDSEPIEAWRCWRVEERKGRMQLVSITHRVGWKPMRPMRAHCVTALKGLPLPEQHNGTPSLHHGCGIYGVYSPEQTRTWAGLMPTNYMPVAKTMLLRRGPPVLGKIKLWGRVLRHEKGFRAEYAYPSRFYLLKDVEGEPSADEAEEYLEPYGVPIDLTTINTLFGDDDTFEMVK
jgi:hypothetical protein